MTTEQRLRYLEAKLDNLEAVVDGGEEQTREAIVYLVGLERFRFRLNRTIRVHAGLLS